MDRAVGVEQEHGGCAVDGEPAHQVHVVLGCEVDMFDPGLGVGDLGEGSPDLRTGGAGGGGELHEGPAGAELVGEVRAGQSRFLGRGSDVKNVVRRGSKAGRAVAGDPPGHKRGASATATSMPASCATMNAVTLAGAIPANESDNARARLTAGLANDVEAVNQYAAVM